MTERFAITEMSALRNQLLEGGLDYQQAGEMFQLYLMGHGYGVSPQAARAAAYRIGGRGCSVEAIQKELEGIAMVM